MHHTGVSIVSPRFFSKECIITSFDPNNAPGVFAPRPFRGSQVSVSLRDAVH